MKWDDDHFRVIRGYVITGTGRMINGGILTSNGTKCSASQDQSGKIGAKVTRMELGNANLDHFLQTQENYMSPVCGLQREMHRSEGNGTRLEGVTLAKK